jgi:hypothetical protein
MMVYPKKPKTFEEILAHFGYNYFNNANWRIDDVCYNPENNVYYFVVADYRFSITKYHVKSAKEGRGIQSITSEAEKTSSVVEAQKKMIKAYRQLY